MIGVLRNEMSGQRHALRVSTTVGLLDEMSGQRHALRMSTAVSRRTTCHDEDSLNIRVEERGRGFNPPRVSVEPTYNPDPKGAKQIAALEEALQESVDDVCQAMTQEGYEIIDFRESDAELKDLADANDYEFDDKGRPA